MSVCKQVDKKTLQIEALEAFFNFYYSHGFDIPDRIEINREFKPTQKFHGSNRSLEKECDVCLSIYFNKKALLDSTPREIEIDSKNTKLIMGLHDMGEDNVWFFSNLLPTDNDNEKAMQFSMENCGERLYGVILLVLNKGKVQFKKEISTHLVQD